MNIELLREIDKLCIIAKEPNCSLLLLDYIIGRIQAIGIILIQEELQTE